MRTNFMADHGARLVDNGYSIIPIMPGTKKPGRYLQDAGWKDFHRWRQFSTTPVSPYHLSSWEKWPGCGVGVLCGGVCPIDIDILDQDIAIQVADIIEDILGASRCVRIGKRPKMLLVYRTEEPFSKIQMHPIECLAEGQQFVAYAVHPDTGEPYDWPLDHLADTPIDRLPVVTEAQVRKAMEAAYAVIPDHMKPRRVLSAPSAEPRVSGDLEGTPEGIAECMARIPNDDVSWDDWNRIGMALYAASGGRAFSLFDDFSRRSAKYDPKETLRRWNSYARSRPTSIGMGTLIHLAQQYGSTPIPSDVPFNETKREAAQLDITSLVEAASATASKQDMVGLTKSERELFPSEWLQTPSLVGQIARWILETAEIKHPTFAVAHTLAALGMVFGRRYRLHKYNTRANLFVIGIAKTGSGKDHSRKRLDELLTAAGFGKNLMGGEYTSPASVLGFMYSEPSALSMPDEIGHFLQSIQDKNASVQKKGLMKMFLELYSSSSGKYRGQEYANKVECPRQDIVAPNFNVYGVTTPFALLPALSRRLVHDGTMSRILLVPPFEDYPTPCDDFAEPYLPIELVASLQEISGMSVEGENLSMMQMATDAPTLIEVGFDEVVGSAIRDVRSVEQTLKNSGREIWVRFLETTLKLAMIEAIARNARSPTITLETLNMGRRLAEWSFSYAERVFTDEVGENPIERDKKTVLRVIKEGGSDGASLTTITRRTQGLVRETRNRLLEDLEAAGQICRADQESTGGRPPRHYFYIENGC